MILHDDTDRVAPATILLLEDEPLIAMDIESTLIDAGFTVIALRTVSAAHLWLAGNRPDSAIIGMALIDGSCQGIAADLAARAIPFVVHSGKDMSSDIPAAFTYGIWLDKPADMVGLVDALRQAMTPRGGETA